MTKSGLLALSSATLLLVLGSLTTGHAASAHDSQAGADGLSNVSAQTRPGSAAQG